MIPLKNSLVGTPFPLNLLCGNVVPMRSRPTTPLDESDVHVYYHLMILITLSMYLDISFNSHLLSVFIDAFMSYPTYILAIRYFHIVPDLFPKAIY